MKRIKLRSRKILRKIFNCFSLTAVAFVFQACYGMGPDTYCDMRLTGTVTSSTTNLPIQGIKVSVDEGINHCFTDENGKFDFYASFDMYHSPNGINIHFLDVDGVENGYFADKTMIVERACKDEVKINVELDEIE